MNRRGVLAVVAFGMWVGTAWILPAEAGFQVLAVPALGLAVLAVALFLYEVVGQE
jgi:hypothetical protein